MIKTLELNLGAVSGLVDPPAIGVPVVEPGVVLASGYYTEQTSGQLYYYDAINDQWYYVTAAGLLYPAAAPSWKPSPSPKIELVGGDTLAIVLHFKYIGPAVTRTFRAALGDNKTSGSFAEWTEWFADEKWYWEGPVDIAEQDTPTGVTQYIYLPIPTKPEVWGDHGGKDAACYCKIMDGFTLTEGVNCTPYYYDVCHVIKVKGEFTEFSITEFLKV